ncbi:MAG: tetratricopeptide repeat protein [Ardenticatenaceae bacterium]|nr:tetratricopeptide repeat protein [Ardenticatenaceae bacterium]
MVDLEFTRKIRLFGPFSLEFTRSAEADSVEAASSALRRKTRALLGYLIADGRAYNRQLLADWFCATADDPARALRMLLSRVRTGVGAESITVERDRIRFNADVVWVDLLLFSRLLAGDLHTCALADLETAVSLYRGEFLEGLTLNDAPEFEIWLLGERTRLRNQYERALLTLVNRHQAAGEAAAALPYAQRLVQSNPLLEEGQAHLIRLYAQLGQREAALAQYEQCRHFLQQELAVVPAPELQALYEDIRAGRGVSSGGPMKTAVSPPQSFAAVEFVGREAELAQLQRAWNEAENGRSQTIIITASAGGGKTRLVQAYAQQLPAVTFAHAVCYESTQAAPYTPWIHLLEMMLAKHGRRHLSTMPDHWRAELARLLPALAGELAPIGTSGQVTHLFHAVAHLLLAAAQPMLILVDDLQWADAASLQLFHFLAQQLRRYAETAVLLIGTVRSEESGDNPALLTLLHDLPRAGQYVQMSLPPLTAVAIDQLLAQQWPDLPVGYRTPHLRDKLLRATGGNPLFVSEIIRELSQAETLPQTLPVPPSMHDLIQRRLQRLSASGRQVIETLAVLDNPGSALLLQQISARSDEETVTALEMGLRWRLLSETSAAAEYDFNHDLMRTAVLAQLSQARLRLLHRRAAQALQAAAVAPDRLVYHWGMAGDAAQEGHYALLAGTAAAAIYANEEAVHYLRLAAARLTDLAQRADALGYLGNVLILVGDWDEAEAVYRQGLALFVATTDRQRQAQFAGALGQVMSRRGRYAEALEWLAQALAASEAVDDTAGMARYVGTMGIVHFLRDELQQALACYQEALDLERAIDNQVGMALWTGNIAGVYNQMGQHEAALTAYQSALAMQRELGLKQAAAIALGNIGNVYHQLGNLTQALDHHLQALLLRHELGDKAGVAIALSVLGDDYAALGAQDAALACYGAALAVDAAVGRADGLAASLTDLGVMALRRDDGARAILLLETAVTRLRALQVTYQLGQTLFALGQAYLAQEQFAPAVTCFAEADSLLAGMDVELAFRARVGAAQAQTASGAQDGALLAALLAEADAPWQRAWVLAAQLALTEADEALRQEAALLFRELYAAVPRDEYGRFYTHMTGETLPTPPVPPLPDLVRQYYPDDLDGLLHTLLASS